MEEVKMKKENPTQQKYETPEDFEDPYEKACCPATTPEDIEYINSRLGLGKKQKE